MPLIDHRTSRLRHLVLASALTTFVVALPAVAQEVREPEGGPLPPYAKIIHLPPEQLATPRVDLVDNGLPNIMITGYWPPTNEMIRRWSNNPIQNPDGWIGENWEGRGYNIYAFFPEFPQGVGKGEGDFEVDYQDTSNDWWLIVPQVQPVAMITFSRGVTTNGWEIEGGNRMYALSAWMDDYLAPFDPTPELPIAGEPPGNERWSSLPKQGIQSAVQSSGASVIPSITYIDDSNFLSNYIGYHGCWYHDQNAARWDPEWNVAAGHIHVGDSIPLADAVIATEASLRALLAYVDQELDMPGDVNCDYFVKQDDVPAFVLALVDPDGYAAAYQGCDRLRGDLNGDGSLDGLDIAWLVDFFMNDCNGSGLPDSEDIAVSFSEDCNVNGVPDECDIASGTSLDVNVNNIPDECEDYTAPTPNPMTWEIAPVPSSTTAITMTATLASDPSDVEYRFYSGAGAALSPWQTGRSHLHSGLNPNSLYSYKVKARDRSPQHNETAFSTPVWYSATAIQTPTGVSFANIQSTSMSVTASGTFSNLSAGDSGLYFEMTPDVPGSGANVWTHGTTSTTINVTGLSPSTTYTFRVKARNFWGTRGPAYETPWTDYFQATTLD